MNTQTRASRIGGLSYSAFGHFRQRAMPATLGLIAFLIAASCLGVVSSTKDAAYAEGVNTLSDVLGVSRNSLVGHLESLEGSGFYLGTPYRPYDWRSPNGDPRFNGGVPGMNCTGFVWYALVACGADPNTTPALSGWVNLIRNNNMKCYYFNTKEDMLSSGQLQKGDIIWMFDNNTGGMDSISDYHHIGVFWGDSPADDKMWHSIDTYGGNVISPITPKASNCLYVAMKTEDTGSLELSKRSDNPSITEGNSSYTLEGARYGVFSPSGVQVAALVTDASGFARVEGLSAGAYSVRETSAPRGYVLDTTSYAVSVAPGQTTKVNGVAGLSDSPFHNPVEVLLRKVDAETGSALPQGAAILEGARFRVSYFDGYHSLTDTSWLGTTAPLRTWEYVIDSEGVLSFGSPASEGGSAPYLTGEGRITLPLGTVAIQETQAPVGYLPDTQTHIRQITVDGSGPVVSSYASPVSEEQVKRGDLELVKASEGSAHRLANIPFAITSKTTGESHTVVTDANGYASTASSWSPHSFNTNAGSCAEDGIWFGTSPADDGKGALVYDTYLIDELPCEANLGKELIRGVEIRISRDGHTVNLGTVLNEDLPVIIVSKVDDVTGEQLAGAKLELYELQDGLWEKVGETVTTESEWEIPVLPGRYRIVETEPPKIEEKQYLLSEDVVFDITEDKKINQVEIKDVLTKVDLSKQDATTGKELAGAELKLFDSAGKVVRQWTSTAQPYRIEGLVPGSYRLHEDLSPVGYLIAGDVTFEMGSSGVVQKVVMKDEPVTKASLPKAHDPIAKVLPVLGFVGFLACLLVLAGCIKKRYR